MKEEMLELLARMARIREFELMAEKIFFSGEIQGFVHLYRGEEATATGICAALRNDDYVTSTHRGHGHLIAKGADVNAMLAELCGKATGCNGGKGGSMHIADIDRGILGANGLLAAGMTLACGAGFSAKYRGTDQVAVSFFGDGSSSEGEFHETLNLASLWKLPVIFVCENNGFGVTNPVENALAVKNVADRAAGYSMPGVIVDGNDVLAVLAAAREAVARARAGEGPTLIECKTTRCGGHYVGDASLYVPQEIRDTWPGRDCIENFSKKLVAEGIATEDEVKAVRGAEVRRLRDALEFARQSPYPPVTAAVENVYSDFVEEGRNR